MKSYHSRFVNSVLNRPWFRQLFFFCLKEESNQIIKEKGIDMQQIIFFVMELSTDLFFGVNDQECLPYIVFF